MLSTFLPSETFSQSPISLSPHSPVLESTTTVGQVGMKCKGGIYSTATRALIRRLYTSIFWPLSAEVLAALQC